MRNVPAKHHHKWYDSKKGAHNKSNMYRALRSTNLKEMYIVRYADDFKIFCRKRSDSDKTFIAVKLWLQDRLKLQISEEKSKVVNLKRHYYEFLDFKMKAVKKGKKYVVGSHIRDKAVKKITEELIGSVKKIQKPNDKKQAVFEIQKFNQKVEGIQNYYRYATYFNIDCMIIQRSVNTVIKNRLKGRTKKHGIIENTHSKRKVQ